MMLTSVEPVANDSPPIASTRLNIVGYQERLRTKDVSVDAWQTTDGAAIPSPHPDDPTSYAQSQRPPDPAPGRAQSLRHGIP